MNIYQIQEGGSWEVRVSLAAVGNWIRSLGRIEPHIAFGEGAPMPSRSLPYPPEITKLAVAVEESPDEDNDVRRKRTRVMAVLPHAAYLSKTPAGEGRAPMRPDANRPVWQG